MGHIFYIEKINRGIDGVNVVEGICQTSQFCTSQKLSPKEFIGQFINKGERNIEPSRNHKASKSSEKKGARYIEITGPNEKSF